MKVHILGISHPNPLCRRRIVQELRDLTTQYQGQPPCFIAVEPNEQTYRVIAGQRDSFRDLFKSRWPQLPENHVDTFVQGLGYEGDAHRVVFPNTPVLWLEEYRPVPDNFASSRLGGYLLHLQTIRLVDSTLQESDPEFIPKFIRAALIAQPPASRDDRNAHFANAIRSRLYSCRKDWAVAIIGYNHAGDEPDSVYRRLIEMGIEVDRKSLTEEANYGTASPL